MDGCGSITLAIGPEGGWSAREEERAAVPDGSRAVAPEHGRPVPKLLGGNGGRRAFPRLLIGVGWNERAQQRA